MIQSIMSVQPVMLPAVDLEALADELEVTITEGALPFGWWGAYDSQRHQIILLPSLGPVQLRSTLAHELGHAYYKHDGITGKQERQASVWSCRRLIDQSEFIDALQTANDLQSVSHILGVMPEDVRTFTSTLAQAEKLLITQIIQQGCHRSERHRHGAITTATRSAHNR